MFIIASKGNIKKLLSNLSQMFGNSGLRSPIIAVSSTCNFQFYSSNQVRNSWHLVPHGDKN